MTHAERISTDGRTEVTIADGLIYIDIFRGESLVEQRKYNASNLIDLNIDRLLLMSRLPKERKVTHASR